MTPAFQQWLERQDFQPTTRKLYYREADLFSYLTREGEEISFRRSMRDALSALRRFDDAEHELSPTLRRAVDRYLETKPPKAKRKKLARSVDDQTWGELLDAIEEDSSDEARVIEVITATGLRIGDVLRIRYDEMKHAMRTRTLELDLKGGKQALIRLDGAPEVWDRLWDRWNDYRFTSKNVAGWICPENDSPEAGECAYKRVQRKLKEIQKTAGISDRMYLHRLRRTVAVQALRITKDVGAVQQMLAHSSSQTTLGYLDEARPDDVADLQRDLRKRFGR